ncbi:MAG: 16S rRNA processing protein RimM [Acidimicrobiaceae bacterium]|nr:16S rRNA processing protein RimM [Acidimicrobiaceae bacterium]
MKLLEVARIGKAHGLQGELSVHLITNITERVSPGSLLFLEDESELLVKSSKPYKRNYLVMFEGVNSRSSAEELVGEILYGAPIDDDTIIWAHEVIGSRVLDKDRKEIGVVAAVEPNPASDLLVLEDGSLIPMVFVKGQEEMIVNVEIPSGLLERGDNEN